MSITHWLSFIFVYLLQVSGNDSVPAIDQPVSERGLLEFLFGPCRCRCGIPNREARLVGGEYLRGHEFPWASVVQLPGNVSFPATLINDKYLLTSANAVIGFTPLDMKVTVGLFDRCFSDVSSMNISVSHIIIHPDFSPGNRAHDIALLQLSIPVRFERRISPICLATPNTRYLGQVATVYSWTQTVSTNRSDGINKTITSCRPRKLGLPVLDYQECVNAAHDSNYVSIDKGCIGVIGSFSPICKVDSGGPVTFRSRQGVYELIGILSDQNVCDPTQPPSVALFATINDHMSWIIQNTKDACYCVKT